MTGTGLVEHGARETTGTVLDHDPEPAAETYTERQFRTALTTSRTDVEELVAGPVP